ncbi:MAG: KUP/HAK/KT family potassium transporter [Tatlockia sp.]|jgi:KUP system potassium uptake protein
MSKKKIPWMLSLGALGVVFGDIGTSPLYALRVTLDNLPINYNDILGVLSLIFWSLIITISIKYLMVIFRADNDGEGGSLALLALLKQKKTKYESFFYLIAIFGTGLIIGDGMLTPAISVMSAMEGLGVISPQLNDYILPMACVILLLLFLMQSYGTTKIGGAFGPVLLVWFITIAALGLAEIIKNPQILWAVNPYYALKFFYTNGMKGFFLLGGVFLVVTGGEALYADIGHFGKNPIRYSWFLVALPSLVINYFGQGAHLLRHPEAIGNPFFMIAPDWFNIPLVILSTLATVTASQAVISATFSLTRQAVLLGLCPRIPITQTSKKYIGQIYIPQMNALLLVGTLLLIFTFKSSEGLAHAYGIAVNLVMLLVTTMVAYAAKEVWLWPRWRVILIFSPFICVDLIFLIANSHKFLTGGWVPVCFALVISFIMFTWNKGMQYLKKNFYMQKEDISKILKQLNYKSLNQLPHVTAIFITDTYDRSGGGFLHFLKLSHAVPEKILIVNFKVENTPYVDISRRFEINPIDKRVSELTLHYGFMDAISVPRALSKAVQRGLLSFEFKIESATYLVEVPHVVASKQKKTLAFYWQEKLFTFLMRNYSANLNIEFYKLPYNRTIAIGSYCVI